MSGLYVVENIMHEITTIGDLKGRLQAGFENNEESLEEFGKTYSTQLKAYLIESNLSVDVAGCPIGKWRGLDSTGWYGNLDKNLTNTLFLDGTRERVWIIYSILDAAESDLAIKNWVESRKGLDRCWLQYFRNYRVPNTIPSHNNLANIHQNHLESTQ